MPEIVIASLILAFFFTFTNGFQDASSVAASFIASRSATPAQGILMVGIMDFLGALLGGSAVAFTISSIFTVPLNAAMVCVLFTALLAAIFWNLLTWWFGIPSSSTHALIGGMVGAGIAAFGVSGINWGLAELITSPVHLAGMTKICFFLIVSVLLGLICGFAMKKTTRFLLANATRKINRKIIRINWITTAIMAFTNGANDAQKQLGVIAMVLFSTGEIATLEIPVWTRIVCAALLALGTFGGGWRIMKTLGNRIFNIKPIHSFDSQVSSGGVILVSTLLGAPVSSSHVITTSILGVGAAQNLRKVQWSVGTDIIFAMIITIPVTMLLAAGMYICLTGIWY
ncbi:MAG: inorganic phosphate transporter [Methanospirillaceae archaeon]|nr:inorganic phosphate transporter [Methanospirillaceae archaeon]